MRVERRNNVPRIKRGKSWPKITHITKTWRSKHAAQKNQKIHEFRFCRPHIRTPKSATIVHMIAACHLCGGLPLSRMIAAMSPSTMPIQPMASSLKESFLRTLCISLHAPDRNRNADLMLKQRTSLAGEKSPLHSFKLKAEFRPCGPLWLYAS
jgi:hypothetical protein